MGRHSLHDKRFVTTGNEHGGVSSYVELRD
jgi:hypothetical protein